MGYNMTQQPSSKFHLSTKKHPEAFELLKKLAPTGNNYHFVAWDAHAQAKNLCELMEAHRWHPTVDTRGNILKLEFTGERLGGLEEKFFKLLRLSGAAGHIDMVGENGEAWSWLLNS